MYQALQRPEVNRCPTLALTPEVGTCDGFNENGVAAQKVTFVEQKHRVAERMAGHVQRLKSDVADGIRGTIPNRLIVQLGGDDIERMNGVVWVQIVGNLQLVGEWWTAADV